jgi:hypothetical protein
MSMDQHTPYESIELGHEPVETDVRAVWRTAAVITGVVLGAFLLIVGMMKWFGRVEGSPASGYSEKPDLNWSKQNSLQQLRNQEQALLSNYGWIDREAGVARIPVDRAIEIITQNGLPTQLQGLSSSGQNSTQQVIEPENPPANAEGDER